MKVTKIFQPSHVGELIQVPTLYYERLGRAIRCAPQVQLVTLLCPQVGSDVIFFPRTGHTLDFLGPNKLSKASGAVALLLAQLNRKLEGTFFVEHRLPELGSGLGLGRSSADVIGALRAVLYTLRLPEEHLLQFVGQLAQRAEKAVDPLFHSHPVLFASREGRILKHYPQLPPMAAMGFVFNRPVDTIALADSQKARGFPSENLASAPLVLKIFEAGVMRRDTNLLLEAVTLSGELNQSLVPFPMYSELRRFAKTAGAALSISHSGSAGALLIPGQPDPQAVNAIAAQFERTFETPTFIWNLPC